MSELNRRIMILGKILLIVFFMLFSNSLSEEVKQEFFNQEIKPIKINKSSIENFTIVVFSETIYFSLVGYDDVGIDSIRIMNGDQLLKEKNCMNNKFCKASGSIKKELLNSMVVDAIVNVKDGRTEREKIRINSFHDGKMYAVVNFFGEEELSPPPPPEVSTENTLLKDMPTEYKIASKKTTRGINLDIVVKDEDGINYIEVLENDEFKDVMLCRGTKDCAFNLELIRKGDETNISSKCTIKIRDQQGNLTTEEKILNY